MLETLEERQLLAASYPTGFLTGPDPGNPLDITLSYLKANGSDWGVAPADIGTLFVTDQYTDDMGTHATHIYLRQGFNGLQVDNANITAGLMPDGEIINVAGSFVPGLAAQATGQTPAPALTASQALYAAAPTLGLRPALVPSVVSTQGGPQQSAILNAPGISLDPVPASLHYVADGKGGASLTWDFVVRTPDDQHDYDISVDAAAGTILRQADWLDHFSDASYNVYPLPLKSPDQGTRQVLVNPSDPVSSPFGWQNTGNTPGVTFTDTRGNNVDAYEDTGSTNAPGKRADGGSSLNFNFPLDLTLDPSKYQNAVITNLFYLTNVAHDIHYHYGFDEVAGNFQVNNYGKGGLGNDPLHAQAQDGAGTDNADMLTPPDGQSGRMRMFLWDLTDPHRDGSLDSEVVIHEFGHGVSNRLTGGPSNASALDENQSGGMGEGWSDFWAAMFTALPSDKIDTPRPTGNYILGLPESGAGIRRFPYDYNMTIDPLTFADYNKDTSDNGGPEVHNTGEIWCSTLWDMNSLLVQKYGFDPNLAKGYSPGAAGNLLSLQLVMDALKLQPANPSFIDARNAILAADQALTGGENQPEIWKAFARRGLGLSAKTADANSTTVTLGTDMPNFLKVTVTPPTNVTERQTIGGVTIATISDPATPGPASGYVAKIDWGDGTVVLGTVVDDGNGKFEVKTDKTFGESGTFNLKVTVTKVGSITISASSTLTVKDLPIQVTADTLSSVAEGVTFTGEVATFIDTDPVVSPASSYLAAIDWGDGTVAPGTITAAPGGVFRVTGAHAFGAGSLTTKVTIKGPGVGKASATGSITVKDSLLSANPVVFHPVEGQVFSGVIATFVDNDPRPLAPSYYSATIDWGDGTTGPGRITILPTGGFGVAGDHTFKVGAYNVSVTIADSDVSRVTLSNITGITDPAAISLRGTKFQASEGVAFNGLVGAFQTANHGAAASDFSATVNWGDGTSDAGHVVFDGDGQFLVTGTHTYRYSTTPYATSITLIENALPDRAISGQPGQVTVTAAPISAQGGAITAIAGRPFTGAIATFASGSSLAKASDFSATVEWGDGTESAATVVQTDSGKFTVLGNDTYTVPGKFAYAVQIIAPGTALRTGGPAAVLDAPLTPIGSFHDAVAKTSTGTIVAGSFLDGNPYSRPDQFAVTIDWGDGSTSPGQVVANPNGGYDVLGSHTYAEGGTYLLESKIVTGQGTKAATAGAMRVAELILPISGTLDPSSDSGASHNDARTNVTQPTFTGKALAGSTVVLYAQPADGGGASAVGQGVTGSDGTWHVTSGHLAPGTYRIMAQAIDAQGHPVSALTPLALAGPDGGLIIDTTGPHVTQVTLNPATRTFRVTYAAGASGLDDASILNPANYSVSLAGRARNFGLPTVTLDPNDPSTALVHFNLGRPRGNYVITINSAGITDRAGNVLSERYYLDFPGTTQQPGSPFVAQISTDGRTATPAVPFVPSDQFQAAQRFGSFLRGRLRATRKR